MGTQTELHKKGNLDSIKINCEVVSGQYDRAELEKQVAKRIKDMIGVSAEIDVIDVGGVPRSQGKAQRIVDLRGV